MPARSSRPSRRSLRLHRRRAAPVTSAGSNDMVTQLENLKKLLDDGVLTQAEFDMEKQKLLASS